MEADNFTKGYISLGMLTTILDCIDAFIFVSDIQTGEVLFINGRMREHFNLGDNAIGDICWKVFQGRFIKPCDECPLPRLIENPGEPLVWEGRSSITGHVYRNISRIVEWPDGKQIHLLHATDITDIRLAEERLRKSLEQEKLMSAISLSFTTTRDTGDLIVGALRMSGQFIGANHVFLAKYQKDEGCLECLYEWFDDVGRPYIGGEHKWPISPDMEIYRDLTVQGYAAVSDYFLLTHPNFQTVKDHRQRAFLNIPVEISGEFWGLTGFIIAERAYEWSESDIHLGKLIAGVLSGAISRQIVEEDLYRAKDEAVMASRAKGDFLSRMSHEIRTPMNAIIGMTQIARRSDDPQKKEYCLERIDSASKHLLGLINDILDMSKIEANKLELAAAEFELEQLLLNVTTVVNCKAEEKQQNIVVNVGADVPAVLIGDELRLNQVIVNLLTNAVKFTPEHGTIALKIRNNGVSDDMAELLVEVADTGIGISAEQQARLFSPFEQADSGITRKYGGTGLGLTICKGIVELMGGRIWIESELGKGSKFCFTVHMLVGDAAQEPGSANTAHNDAASIYDFREYTLLAADDIEVNREILFAVLEDTNVAIDFAHNGVEALSQFQQNPEKYSAILMDIQMPEMNGYDATKSIRALHMARAKEIPIIAMTADVFREDIERCIEAGMDDHIGKPLDTEELLSKLHAYLIPKFAQKERNGEIQ